MQSTVVFIHFDPQIILVGAVWQRCAHVRIRTFVQNLRQKMRTLRKCANS